MKKLTLPVLAVFSLVLLFLGACSGALGRPTDLKLNETNWMLSWAPVANATSSTVYQIEINGKENVSSKTSYPLDHLPEGEYKIRVKATDAIGQNRDSRWSDVFVFNKPYENGLVYTLINANTEYEVTRVGSARGKIETGDFYRGKPVTSIAYQAFYSNSTITSIVIGKNIKKIGDYAFTNCSNLESATFPDGLEKIGKHAFQGCRALKTVVIPNNLNTIEESAFQFCRNMTSLSIGKTVTAIEKSAFAGCDKLREVVIPDSVRKIGEKAFNECSLLESVRLGEGADSIGVSAFADCVALKDFDCGTRLSTIGASAFKGCKSMQAFSVPDSVTTIGQKVFLDCALLSEVIIGEGVTKIGGDAFKNTALSEETPDVVYADGWVVASKPDLTELSLLSETRGIADYAFLNTKITEAVIPDSVAYIGEYAFAGCTELMSLDVGDGMVNIGRNAFDGCKVLGRGFFSLGSSVKTIDSYAFARCADLGNSAYMNGITIPRTVETIGTYAFFNTAAWNVAESGVVYVGNWAVGFKESDENLSITIRDGTVGISNYAFYRKTKLGAVTIPDSVKYIGYGAFYECTSLSRVYIDVLGSGLSEIGEYVFYKCANLKQVDIPIEVEKIGRSAFYKSGVMVAKIPKWVNEIGPYAFYGCENLLEVTFDSDSRLETIDDYAFANCTTLQSFSVPTAVWSIGVRAFSKCASLKSIDLNRNLKRLGDYAFFQCESLESVVLPDSLEELNNKVFYKCSSLTSVTFGSNLKTIGEYAFYSCLQLASLNLPASLRVIGNYAFRNCTALTSVVLREEITEIGSHAFNGCKYLTLFCEGQKPQDGWSVRWNSGYRPVVWNCTLSPEGDYVLFFVMSEGGVDNKTAKNGLSDPLRDGYILDGWSLETDGESKMFSADKVAEAPTGAVLTAVWKEEQPAPPTPPEDDHA